MKILFIFSGKHQSRQASDEGPKLFFLEDTLNAVVVDESYLQSHSRFTRFPSASFFLSLFRSFRHLRHIDNGIIMISSSVERNVSR